MEIFQKILKTGLPGRGFVSPPANAKDTGESPEVTWKDSTRQEQLSLQGTSSEPAL